MNRKNIKYLLILVSIFMFLLGIALMSNAGDLENNKNCPKCEECEPCDECPMPPSCPRCPKCPDLSCPVPVCPQPICEATVCPEPCPEDKSVSGAYHVFGMGLSEQNPALSIGLGSISVSPDGSCGIMHVCDNHGCTGYVLKSVKERVK